MCSVYNISISKVDIDLIKGFQHIKVIEYLSMVVKQISFEYVVMFIIGSS